jgi:hypothetical protein
VRSALVPRGLRQPPPVGHAEIPTSGPGPFRTVRTGGSFTSTSSHSVRSYCRIGRLASVRRIGAFPGDGFLLPPIMGRCSRHRIRDLRLHPVSDPAGPAVLRSFCNRILDQVLWLITAPIRLFTYAMLVVEIACGRDAGWTTVRRPAHRSTLSHSIRTYCPRTLIGATVLVILIFTDSWARVVARPRTAELDARRPVDTRARVAANRCPGATSRGAADT